MPCVSIVSGCCFVLFGVLDMPKATHLLKPRVLIIGECGLKTPSRSETDTDPHLRSSGTGTNGR